MMSHVVLSKKVWLQTAQKFRIYSKSSHFANGSPRCDLDIEESEPILIRDTPPDDDTPEYQVQLKMVERCRIYRQD